MGVKGKAQEWCRLVWMEVEMWEMGGAIAKMGHPVVVVRSDVRLPSHPVLLAREYQMIVLSQQVFRSFPDEGVRVFPHALDDGKRQ